MDFAIRFIKKIWRDFGTNIIALVVAIILFVVGVVWANSIFEKKALEYEVYQKDLYESWKKVNPIVQDKYRLDFKEWSILKNNNLLPTDNPQPIKLEK